MAEKSFLEKPIPRGRTKKERIAILLKVAEMIDADPELRADLKEFIRATTR